jgi:hypothetical protein
MSWCCVCCRLSAGDTGGEALDMHGRQFSEGSCVTASSDMGHGEHHSRLPHFTSACCHARAMEIWTRVSSQHADTMTTLQPDVLFC